jgi:hypothetical protein
VTLPPCPPDVRNHGAYVSSVARGAAPGTAGVRGRDHGALVSAAAHSTCGVEVEDNSAEREHAKKAGPKPPRTAKQHPHKSAAKTEDSESEHETEAPESESPETESPDSGSPKSDSPSPRPSSSGSGRHGSESGGSGSGSSSSEND